MVALISSPSPLLQHSVSSRHLRTRCAINWTANFRSTVLVVRLAASIAAGSRTSIEFFRFPFIADREPRKSKFPSFGYYDRRLCCDGCLSSAMHTSDDSEWPVHSFMLSINDFSRPSTATATFCCSFFTLFFNVVPWFSAQYHVGRHDRTMIACDAWWLPRKGPDLRWGFDLLPYILVSFVFLVWDAKHRPVAIVFRVWFGFVSPDLTYIGRAALTGQVALVCTVQSLQENWWLYFWTKVLATFALKFPCECCIIADQQISISLCFAN